MARRPAVPGVERREQILEAALDVFAEEGFEGATTKEIATRADVTQGLIYFYFPSKKDLFLAAYEHEATQAFAHLRVMASEQSDEPPAAVIRRAITEIVEAMDSPRSLCLMRIMMRVAAHAEDREHGDQLLEAGRQRIRDQAQGIVAAFKQYLDGQVAQGRLRAVDTALVAQLIMNGILVTVMRRASGDETLAHLSRQQFVDTVVEVFLHGLLVRPGDHG